MAGNPGDDADFDGSTNLQEYEAGTHPTNALSHLRVDSIALTNGGSATRLTFQAASNKTYTIQHRAGADSGPWNRLTDILAASSNRVIEVVDTHGPAVNPQRVYRLATPRQP